jgi:hypothetical protein
MSLKERKTLETQNKHCAGCFARRAIGRTMGDAGFVKVRLGTVSPLGHVPPATRPMFFYFPLHTTLPLVQRGGHSARELDWIHYCL